MTNSVLRLVEKHGRRISGVCVALAGLMLSACIDSTAPILSNGKPDFGEQVQFHLYSLYDGAAHQAEIVTYRWNGTRYAVSGKRPNDMSDFTIHDFEGPDAIVQGISIKKGKTIDYALARKLADGTYLVIPIDENDADEATRGKFCIKDKSSPCRVESHDQLVAFARATAAKPHQQGGLAVLVTKR
ncbi:MAG: hypothetical protein WD073_05785 [Xanthobacteraceae bacterium]